MEKKFTAIKIGAGRNINISNNITRGMGLLDAEKATIYNLVMKNNKMYGHENPIKLGRIFGAEISGNLFDTEVPEILVSEIKNAAKSETAKKTFLTKMASILTKPSEYEAIVALVERASRLLPS